MNKLIGFMMFFMLPSEANFQQDYCMDVVANFDWRTGYLEGNRDDVAPECCPGQEKLNNIAKFEGPRRICECIKDMANHQLGIPYIPSRIADLYVKCLSFPISQSMDCSTQLL